MFGVSGSQECFCLSGCGRVYLEHSRHKSDTLKVLGLCICNLRHWKCVCVCVCARVCSECWKFVSV